MPNLVSLFSGGGGLDCGFEAAGFESRFCSDIDYHSCVTLLRMKRSARRNRPGGLRSAAIIRRDIALFTNPEEILRRARLAIGEIDLLAGGPPCQSFSVFGRRQGLEDPRGQLVWQYLRILQGVRPRAFIFENVPGLLSIDNGAVFQRFLDEVQQPFGEAQHRYTVRRYVLEAARYGVPQFRTRVIVLGVLNGIGLPPPPEEGPIETHVEPDAFDCLNGVMLPFNTAHDALQGLPAIGSANAPCNHIGRVHSAAIIERYHALQHGQRDTATRINKLHPERPSYTIIVGSNQGGGKGHVHPYEPREVTPRESARMQSFPDWWEFSGTSRHPIRQIGNAVPPILAAAIGSFIRERIFGERPIPRREIWQALGQHHLLEAEDERRPRIPNLYLPPAPRAPLLVDAVPVNFYNVGLGRELLDAVD